MKFLICLIFTVFGAQAMAAPLWISKSDLADRKAGNRGHTFYKTQSLCETAKAPDICFNPTDHRRQKAGFRAIDIERTMDCVNSADCISIRDTPPLLFSCGDRQIVSFDDKVNWPALDFAAETPPRPAMGWFLWCQKEILVADSVGGAAADAEDTKKVADKVTRRNKKNTRKTAAAACVVAVNGGGNLTGPQLKACVSALVKEVFEGVIAPKDL